MFNWVFFISVLVLTCNLTALSLIKLLVVHGAGDRPSVQHKDNPVKIILTRQG
jgi:hypothetical protein